MSCNDFDSFRGLLLDYRISHEEEERYKVLTIKTNKLPENKKVKGNTENIFGNSNMPTFGGKNPSKKPIQQKKVTEKTED